MITVPNVIPTLLPCFIFSCVERRFGGGKTEDEQSQKEQCRREVHGHNGEIKRKNCEKKIDEREVRYI